MTGNSPVSADEAQIFIVGSCVSRNIFEFDTAGCLIKGYVARTSFATIEMDPVTDPQVRAAANNLTSAFQRKMLLNDLDKSTLKQVSATPARFVLVDFVEERFKLVRAGDSLFSLTGELEKGGFAVGDREVVEPGWDEYYAMWLAGFERFLSTLGKEHEVLLNKAFWANDVVDHPDAHRSCWVERNNAQLTRLYALVDACWKLNAIEYPESLVVADPAHKWGVAPYHYSEALYRYVCARLREIVCMRTRRVWRTLQWNRPTLRFFTGASCANALRMA